MYINIKNQLGLVENTEVEIELKSFFGVTRSNEEKGTNNKKKDSQHRN